MSSAKFIINKVLTRSNVVVCQSQACRNQSGYIVLLPEIPEDTQDTNPVLRAESIDYQKATTNNYFGAVSRLVLENDLSIRKLDQNVQGPDAVLSTLDSLEDAGARLETAYNASTIARVVKMPEMPEPVYKKIQTKTKNVKGSKFMSAPLYSACKEVAKENLTVPQKALVNKYVREGRLNGLDLSETGSTGLRLCREKLNKARTDFRKRVQVTSDGFRQIIGEKNMTKNFPSDLLRAMALDKNKPSQGPWEVTLQPSVLGPFLQHCPDRDERWNAWTANQSRASSTSETQMDNSNEMWNIRKLRNDNAKYLGFKNYAELSMETKMADSVSTVTTMFSLLNAKARPAMEKEIESLQQFAAERGFTDKFDAWDIPFWRRQQMKAEFGVDEGEVREYFPLPSVLKGLFEVSQEMLGIEIKEEKNHTAWNDDVKKFSLRDGSGEELGQFYLDPYLRPKSKFFTRSQNGWVLPERPRSALTGLKPSATLVFNFSPPLHGLPSLLTYEEVQTVFNRFGFALQLLLTQSPNHETNPVNNTPWEVVEAPGQVFQLLLTQPRIIERVSSHFETGHSLPEEAANKLLKSQTHMAAYDLCNEMYLGHFDLESYSTTNYWLDIVKKLWPQYKPFKLDKRDSHPCSFTDIFSENWAASYYSHLWARMIAADIFTAFQEVGFENDDLIKGVGQRFRGTFLENAGLVDSNELFRQFRGRDLSPDALLTISGLKRPKKI